MNDNTLLTNINAEAAVLGSMLLDRDCISPVKGILRDDCYFSLIEHRILFNCLCALSETSNGWDLVIVRDALKNINSLEAIGGTDYLVRLIEHVPSSASAIYYTELVLTAYKRRRMTEQADSLRKAAIEPGDIQEVLQAAQGDICELAKEIDDTKPTDGADAVKNLIDDSILKRRQILKMPWGITGKLTNCLQPGTITVFCGTPGASKSFAVLELLAFVSQPAAIFELEDNKGFHLLRCLAQKTELPGLTNPDWIEQNPAIAEAAHAENAEWLTQIGRAIDANGGGQVTYDNLISWALGRTRTGCKLLIIDPVTAIQHKTKQTWTEDNDFLQKTKRIAVDYGAAVLLVTHPAKTQGTPGMESLAGGAAFSRFSQTILWLEAHDYKTSDVRFPCGCSQVNHNRTLHILKARLGQGQGIRVACTFTDNLRLLEHGAIIRKTKNE